MLFLLFIPVLSCYDLLFDEKPYLSLINTDPQAESYLNPLFNKSLIYLNYLAENDEINSQCRSSIKRYLDVNDLQLLNIRLLFFF